MAEVNQMRFQLKSNVVVVGPIIACAVVLLSILAPSSAHALDKPDTLRSVIEQISGERMMRDVASLSSPAFNGRQTGTDDDVRSAHWVADRFQTSQLSLAPVPSDRFSPPNALGEGPGAVPGFMSTIHRTLIISPAPQVQISTARTPVNLELGTDFLPVLDSPAAHARAPIVFVGYGIVDATVSMNDYDGIDANNCIVLFLRGKPDHYKGTITHMDKVRIARQKGAVGYLTMTGPVLTPYELRRGVTGQPSAFYALVMETDALPGAWINTSQGEQILSGSNFSKLEPLRAIQQQLNESSTSRSFRTEYFGLLEWEVRQIEGSLINVIGMLPGTDPKLAKEAIVIGAHRDHFGRQAGLFFPGADDNASGTAVMLEVARTIASLPMKPKRTLLFVSFSGEEQGLLGSRLYVGRPLVPLTQTQAMINVDHAGIGNGRLTVGITGLDKALLQETAQATSLADEVDLFGFFPGGDHVPFKEAGVPTITVVSGGVHPHFHQPTDTAGTINPDILVSIARYVCALAWRLANLPDGSGQ
jgi:hypothetical protein